MYDVRPAPQKCLCNELPLPLNPSRAARHCRKGANVNRQPITAQHDLAREIRVERYEGDVVAARDQDSHLRKWGGAGEPSGSCDGLVE